MYIEVVLNKPFHKMFRWWLMQWVCRGMGHSHPIPWDSADPYVLFDEVMRSNPSMGRFIAYMVWLSHQPRPSRVWGQLQKRYPDWMYSEWTLLAAWVWYHGKKVCGL